LNVKGDHSFELKYLSSDLIEGKWEIDGNNLRLSFEKLNGRTRQAIQGEENATEAGRKLSNTFRAPDAMLMDELSSWDDAQSLSNCQYDSTSDSLVVQAPADQSSSQRYLRAFHRKVRAQIAD